MDSVVAKVIPKLLKIGGLTVVVEQSRMLASSRDKFGEYSFMEQKITIDQFLSDDKKAATLLHEILEALNGYFELDISHAKLTVLGFALYQVLSDNELQF